MRDALSSTQIQCLKDLSTDVDTDGWGPEDMGFGIKTRYRTYNSRTADKLFGLGMVERKLILGEGPDLMTRHTLARRKHRLTEAGKETLR